MKKQISILSSALLITLALSVSGCSSSQTSDSEFGDDVPADAGTDAVPSESAENGAPAQNTASTSTEASPDQAQVAKPDEHQQVASTDPQPPVEAQAQPSATPEATTAQNSLQPLTPTPTETPHEITPAPVVAAATPTATESPSSTAGSESYNVRRGDTLMRIAFEKYGDIYKWKAIYDANRDKIKDPNVIRPGTVLALENVNNELPARTGKRYTIKQGDTLARISSDVYGTPRKWKKIWEHNKPWIPNPNKIFAGFYLFYTGGNNPEDIERHEEQNPVAPVAQDAPAQEAPREPASSTPAAH